MADGQLALRICHDPLVENHINNHLMGSMFRERFVVIGPGPGPGTSSGAVTDAHIVTAFSEGPIDTAHLGQIRDHIENNDYTAEHVFDTVILGENKRTGYDSGPALATRLGIV